ncbi:MAG: hypothetical protein MI975_09045 [Cytophagales bacterium]|nr:hypothetical protein [Cytophagales bacterium]
MQDLYGLIQVYNLYEDALRLTELTKKGTLEGSFIRGLLKKKFKNDQLANHLLFGSNTNLVKYRMLKSRVRDKLFTIVCERYFKINSKREINAEKTFSFFREINYQGHKNLVFYYLKRYLNKRKIEDLLIRIKFLDLLTQIGWELGKFSCANQYIKELIRLRKEFNLTKSVLRKFNEYIYNRVRYPLVYRRAFLEIIIDDLEKKCDILNSDLLFQVLNSLKVTYYFEHDEFNKIVLIAEKDNRLINIGCHCMLPRNFKILNLLYFSESLIRLKRYRVVYDILDKSLKGFPVSINDSLFGFELIELMIITQIKLKKYYAVHDLLVGIHDKREILTDREQHYKISIVAKAIRLFVNKINNYFIMRKPSGFHLNDKTKFYCDYHLMEKLLRIITECRNNKISMSNSDKSLLLKEYDRYKSYGRKSLLPFEELIDDIFELEEFFQ